MPGRDVGERAPSQDGQLVAALDPERELAVAFIDWMLSPDIQQLLAEQTLTAPSLGGLSFKPDVEKYMAYPEAKMDEMGIFSPDWTLINPMRPQLIEKYNQVFSA